jgi:hypothetical protein
VVIELKTPDVADRPVSHSKNKSIKQLTNKLLCNIQLIDNNIPEIKHNKILCRNNIDGTICLSNISRIATIKIPSPKK